MNLFNPKHIFIGILLFFFIYFDPIKVGVLNWAQLWKIVSIVLFNLYFLFKKYKLPKIVGLYYFFSLSYAINTSTLYYPIETISVLTKQLIFPTLLLFLYSKEQLTSHTKLLNFIKFYSIFIVLSFLPFLFNALPVLGTGYSLGSLGIDDIQGISGLFQRPHSASINVSFSILSFLYIITQKQSLLFRIFYALLIALGLYILFKTYVRTGMLMLGVGTLLFLFYKQSIRKILTLLPFLIVFSYLLVWQIKKDKALIGRIQGERIYKSESEMDLNIRSSGRLEIWKSSVKSFIQNKSGFEILFGIGYTELLRRNEENIGVRVFAHNGFINILVTNGIVAFVFWLFFIIKWLNLIKKSILFTKINQINEIRYSMAIIGMYMAFMLVQGGPLVYHSIFIATSILLLRNKIRQKRQFKQTKKSFFFVKSF